MNLIPFRKIIIETRLTQSKAIECLQKGSFTHLPPLFYVRNPMDFWVKINGSNFTANRLIGYRNGFLPILHGQFIQGQNSTEIHVSMYPPVINVIIASILGGTILFFIIHGLFEYFQTGKPFNEILTFLLVLVIGYGVIMNVFFNPEAKIAEDFMKSLFENE
jgi:hypothetical protein